MLNFAHSAGEKAPNKRYSINSELPVHQNTLACSQKIEAVLFPPEQGRKKMMMNSASEDGKYSDKWVAIRAPIEGKMLKNKGKTLTMIGLMHSISFLYRYHTLTHMNSGFIVRLSNSNGMVTSQHPNPSKYTEIAVKAWMIFLHVSPSFILFLLPLATINLLHCSVVGMLTVNCAVLPTNRLIDPSYPP